MKQLFANFSDKIKKRALCKLPKKLPKEFQQKKEAEAETPEKTTEAPRKKKEAPVASHRKQPPNDDETHRGRRQQGC